MRSRDLFYALDSVRSGLGGASGEKLSAGRGEHGADLDTHATTVPAQTDKVGSNRTGPFSRYEHFARYLSYIPIPDMAGRIYNRWLWLGK